MPAMLPVWTAVASASSVWKTSAGALPCRIALPSKVDLHGAVAGDVDRLDVGVALVGRDRRARGVRRRQRLPAREQVHAAIAGVDRGEDGARRAANLAGQRVALHLREDRAAAAGGPRLRVGQAVDDVAVDAVGDHEPRVDRIGRLRELVEHGHLGPLAHRRGHRGGVVARQVDPAAGRHLALPDRQLLGGPVDVDQAVAEDRSESDAHEGSA